MAAVTDATASLCNLSALDSLTADDFEEILSSWSSFCSATEALLNGDGDLSNESDFVLRVRMLLKFGLGSLAQDHFFSALQGNAIRRFFCYREHVIDEKETFKEKGAAKFWQHFDAYSNVAALRNCSDPIEKSTIQLVLCNALEEISLGKQYQERCLSLMVNGLQGYAESKPKNIQNTEVEKKYLLSKYQLMVSSVLMATLPWHFPEILHWYFKGKLEELSKITGGDCGDDNEPQVNYDMDSDGSSQRKELGKLVGSIGMVVRDLRSLGFASTAEDAYASAIFLLLKDKVNSLAGDDFRTSVLDSIKGWIKTVPLQFLHALLDYLGDSLNYDSPSSGLKSPLASLPSSLDIGIENPTEGLVRWQMRLEYLAYETLQDLRIAKLFEIIVDYPDSSPAIEDLKQCLEYTGQHSKLVDSFIYALRYRLLTAGASTNDILHQYVSTIKALRTIDPAGVFLEAVGEPIREYLKGRKDTIKCIVTMLTDGSGGSSSGAGNSGDSLLEELNREEESQEISVADDDANIDDKQAWINAQSWEPDPVEADPSKGSRSRRKVDILGMIISVIGSKDQLVNEYRVMLAEKLLNKSDYDIDTEIRTLELLKIHFGESSMQRCEIMLNDLILSKRTNTNIKATISSPSQRGDEAMEENGVSLDILTTTILSTNFWPPIQEEALKLPESVEQLLNDYAKRYTEIKTPRKLLWKKNLGTVKLELQFEGKAQQFTVTPMHASIIMQFEDQTSWTSKNLAAAVSVPVDVLNRRINFWISKGILSESSGADPSDHIYTLVDGTVDSSKTCANSGRFDELLAGDDDGERSVASVEDQLRNEMTVYEKFITGMLTNFGSMALERIHNTLKMFCMAEPVYDKSLQQLQSFLSGLVAEDRLELRDGMYFLKK